MINLNLKEIILIAALSICTFSLNSCSYYVSRDGYKTFTPKDTCDVYIYRYLYDKSNLIYVGTIKLSESGLTINCDEDDAVAFLKKEACSANANIVNIIREYSPDNLSSCYRCDAELYIDTANYVINKIATYYPQKIIIKSPFSSLPFDYIYGHMMGMEYVSLNKNFWIDLLNKYNLPAEKSPEAMIGTGISLIYKKFYYNLLFATNALSLVKKDSLKTNISSFKLNLDFGYNILNDGVTISPFIGLRYLYQNHIVSLQSEDISLEQWFNNPDLSLRAHQYSMVMGINLIYPFYRDFVMGMNIGYNINFHYSPMVNSNQNSINNIDSQLMKNFFFGFSFGYGFPL